VWWLWYMIILWCPQEHDNGKIAGEIWVSNFINGEVWIAVGRLSSSNAVLIVQRNHWRLTQADVAMTAATGLLMQELKGLLASHQLLFFFVNETLLVVTLSVWTCMLYAKNALIGLCSNIMIAAGPGVRNTWQTLLDIMFQSHMKRLHCFVWQLCVNGVGSWITCYCDVVQGWFSGEVEQAAGKGEDSLGTVETQDQSASEHWSAKLFHLSCMLMFTVLVMFGLLCWRSGLVSMGLS